MKLSYITKKSYVPTLGEINEEPSETIQGEAYTLKELLQRFAQGQGLERKTVHYFDPEDIDQINKLFNPGAVDLTDLDQLRSEVAWMNEKINQAIASKEEKEQEIEPIEEEKEDVS